MSEDTKVIEHMATTNAVLQNINEAVSKLSNKMDSVQEFNAKCEERLRSGAQTFNKQWEKIDANETQIEKVESRVAVVESRKCPPPFNWGKLIAVMGAMIALFSVVIGIILKG